MRWNLLSALAIVLIGTIFASRVSGQDKPPAPAGPTLDQLQLQVKKDFDRFEKSLFNVAEGLRKTEPDRAELLYRARTQSETQRLADEMAAIADLLEKKARKPGEEASSLYGRAGERQEELLARLEQLLKILQSENERERINKEIARIQDLLKDTNRIIGKQKDVRADTGRGGKPGQNLEEAQESVEKDARKLADKIDRHDAEQTGKPSPSGKPMDGKSSPESKPGDPKPGESKPGESKPGDQKPGEEKKTREPKPNEQKPGDMPPMPGSPMPGSPMDGKPSDGKPMPGNPSQPGRPMPMGESKPGDSDPKAPQQGELSGPQEPQRTQGREELEKARREMQNAIEELKKKKLNEASKDQDDAIAQLEQMKARLEEILRQLRQEEKDIYLAMLETRLQKMLRAQLKINSETTRLESVDKAARGSQTTALSRDEAGNAIEADKTLNLLKEEGSSVAFPEAVEQMRDNMRLVTGRLEKADTGETTQLIEQMIVEGLEEMLLAIQKEMEKSRQEKNKPKQGQQGGEPQDPSLVETIQELKMIRSLQNQVNRLTRQVGIQVDGEQATEPDTIKLIDDLARRQRRIQEATYDLSTGKNK